MLTRALALALPVTMLTACTNAIDVTPARTTTTTTSASAWTIYQSAGPTSTSSAPRQTAESSGTFQPFRPGSTAITYDNAVVPPGASAQLTIRKTGYGTEVHLAVTGLVPNRAYGAHLHTQPCAENPDDSGPHYQNHKDPTSPSVNPVYANPQNEIWLDVTADASGAATSTASHGWDLSPTAPPRALVLHTEHTHTAPGEAGKAGARAACLTLPTP